MNDINTWCGIPSETNPCLLKIMPGVYEVGYYSYSFSIPRYLHIEGSGENITVIKVRGSLDISDGNEIRFITFEGGPIYMKEKCSLKNVTLKVSNIARVITISSSVGKYITAILENITIFSIDDGTSMVEAGISIHNSKVILKKINISMARASMLPPVGYAIQIIDSPDYSGYSPSEVLLDDVHIKNLNTHGLNLTGLRGAVYIYNSVIDSDYWGILLANGIVNIKNSLIKGDKRSLEFFGGSEIPYYVNIALTQLIGPILKGNHGVLKCFNTYDAKYDSLVCP